MSAQLASHPEGLLEVERNIKTGKIIGGVLFVVAVVLLCLGINCYISEDDPRRHFPAYLFWFWAAVTFIWFLLVLGLCTDLRNRRYKILNGE